MEPMEVQMQCACARVRVPAPACASGTSSVYTCRPPRLSPGPRVLKGLIISSTHPSNKKKKGPFFRSIVISRCLPFWSPVSVTVCHSFHTPVLRSARVSCIASACTPSFFYHTFNPPEALLYNNTTTTAFRPVPVVIDRSSQTQPRSCIDHLPLDRSRKPVSPASSLCL